VENLLTDSFFKVLFTGRFQRREVRVNWDPAQRMMPLPLREKIEQFWEIEIAGSPKHAHIFNGPLCRLNRWEIHEPYVTLYFGLTDYKELLHSNQFTDAIEKEFGSPSLSKALGVSAVLVTCDEQILLMKRSAAVGEDSGKIDVFGGHIHPTEHAVEGIPDPFHAIKTEIWEEANLRITMNEPVSCIGLIETTRTKKPELIFEVTSRRRAQDIIASALPSSEWSALFAISAQKNPLLSFLREYSDQISPSALGALWLYAQLSNSGR
jgi:hypothetical protein